MFFFFSFLLLDPCSVLCRRSTIINSAHKIMILLETIRFFLLSLSSTTNFFLFFSLIYLSLCLVDTLISLLLMRVCSIEISNNFCVEQRVGTRYIGWYATWTCICMAMIALAATSNDTNRQSQWTLRCFFPVSLSLSFSLLTKSVLTLQRTDFLLQCLSCSFVLDHNSQPLCNAWPVYAACASVRAGTSMYVCVCVCGWMSLLWCHVWF